LELPLAENAKYPNTASGTTPKTTQQQPAAMFAECIQQHLNAGQMQELMRELAGVDADKIPGS